jgi:hypothetical protein
MLQPLADRASAVSQHVVPFWLPAVEIDALVDLADQIVLAREIAIEQWLGDAELAGQLAGARIKTFFGKQAGGLADKILAALDR